MKDLPAVEDDFKNAKHTCKMMGILQENTFTLKDVSRKELEIHYNWLMSRIKVLTMVLVDSTGLIGMGKYQNGLKWERLKANAMNLVAPFKFVLIDLTE